MNKEYDMDEYFGELKYMVYFYDALIKQNGIKKDSLFDDLGIAYMSYCRVKDSDTMTGRMIISKLEKKFNISPLCVNKKKEYENIVNKVLLGVYYREENIGKYKIELISLVEENNYLQPIFKLLLLLVNLMEAKKIERVIVENKKLYEELKVFSSKFFITPFLEIFYMIEIFFSGNKVHKEVTFNGHMKGLLYIFYCIKSYLNKNFDLCLYYSQECKHYLSEDCNYQQMLFINLLYFGSLNIIGEYEKCMKESKKQLNYLVECNKDNELINETRLHYFTSCIGAKEYKVVIDSLVNKNHYAFNEYILLLLSSFDQDRILFQSFVDRFNKGICDFNDNEDITIIVDYLLSNNRCDSKIKIRDSNLNVGLKELLFKFY